MQIIQYKYKSNTILYNLVTQLIIYIFSLSNHMTNLKDKYYKMITIISLGAENSAFPIVFVLHATDIHKSQIINKTISTILCT